MYAYIYAIVSIICIILIVILIRVFLRWTIGRFRSDVSMKGKVVIVTGANTGIGYYTAKDLASRGARVILGCRNEGKGISAQNSIIKESGNSEVFYKNLNLSDLSSVRKFAAEILESEERLDVLINNAGIFGLGNHVTKDGIVEGMQVNHFAPFLLTLLLLPLLKKSQPSRIVNVNSIMHYLGFLNLHNVNKKGYYGKIRTYANSKLCNLIFTMDLAKRLQGTGVVVNGLHPGVIETNILGKTNIFIRFGFKIWCWICCRSAEDGAQTSLFLAVAEENANVTGKYFVDCKPRFTLWTVRNQSLAQELWKLSETLVGFNSDIDAPGNKMVIEKSKFYRRSKKPVV